MSPTFAGLPARWRELRLRSQLVRIALEASLRRRASCRGLALLEIVEPLAVIVEPLLVKTSDAPKGIDRVHDFPQAPLGLGRAPVSFGRAFRSDALIFAYNRR